MAAFSPLVPCPVLAVGRSPVNALLARSRISIFLNPSKLTHKYPSKKQILFFNRTHRETQPPVAVHEHENVCLEAEDFSSGSSFPLRDLQQSLYVDGFIVLPGLLSSYQTKELFTVIEAGDSCSLPNILHSELLESLLGPLGGLRCDIELREHDVGYGCTDGHHSPSPNWDELWEISEQPDEPSVQSCQLLVAVTDMTTAMSGSIVVYPRSQWLVASCKDSRPSACWPPSLTSLPAAAPLQIKWKAGDVVLMHPLLAWTVAPNASSKKNSYFHCSLYNQDVPPSVPSSGFLEKIGLGWPFHIASSVRVTVEAILQGGDVCSLESPERHTEGEGEVSTAVNWGGAYVAGCDLLAWRLRNKICAFLEEREWGEALPLLRQLAGLRPSSYWGFYQAGWCSLQQAPRGQLYGRAGRKCHLEDGERYLSRAIELAPGWPPAYAAQAHTLVAMGRGREDEVPALVQALMRTAGIPDLCHAFPEAAQAVQDLAVMNDIHTNC